MQNNSIKTNTKTNNMSEDEEEAEMLALFQKATPEMRKAALVLITLFSDKRESLTPSERACLLPALPALKRMQAEGKHDAQIAAMIAECEAAKLHLEECPVRV